MPSILTLFILICECLNSYLNAESIQQHYAKSNLSEYFQLIQRLKSKLNLKKSNDNSGSWIYATANDTKSESPVIIQHSPGLYTPEIDKQAVLVCHWTSNPDANVTWIRETDSRGFKFHPPILDSSVPELQSSTNTVQLYRRVHRNQFSQFVIKNFKPSDAGIYKCLVENWIGSAQARMILFNKNQLLILRRPESKTVDEGSDEISFHCQALSYQGSIVYSWYKGNQRLDIVTSSDPARSRITSYSNGTLFIRRIGRSDSGIYTCCPSLLPDMMNDDSIQGRLQQSNAVDTRCSGNQVANARLVVRYLPSPSIRESRDHQVAYVRRAGWGRIACQLEANPSVQFVEWRRVEPRSSLVTTPSDVMINHTRVVLSSDINSRSKWPVILVASELASYSDPGSTSSIYWYEWDHVATSDEGLYECRGKNALGWGQWSPPVQLLVRDLPTFSERPSQNLILTTTKPPLINCSTYGDPTPVIEWLFVETPLSTHLATSRNQKFGQLDTFIRPTDQLPRGISVLSNNSLLIMPTLNPDLFNSSSSIILYCRASNAIGSLVARTTVQSEWSKSMTLSGVKLSVETENRHVRLIWQGFIQCNESFGQSFFTIYHRLVRSQVDWITKRVQPNNASDIWISGLLPGELYLFKVTKWCRSESPAQVSSTLLVETGSDQGRFDTGSPVWDPSTNSLFPFAQSSKKFPPRPHNLKLAMPRSSRFSSNHRHPTLVWSIDTHHRPFGDYEPVLFYRVEYAIHSYRGLNHRSDQLTWKSLAPIPAPKTSMLLGAASSRPNSGVNYTTGHSLLETLNIVQLRFRVQSFGVSSIGQSSESLVIKTPGMARVIQALIATIDHEHRLIQKTIELLSREVQLSTGTLNKIIQSSNLSQTSNNSFVQSTNWVYSLIGAFLLLTLIVALGLLGMLKYLSLARKIRSRRFVSNNQHNVDQVINKDCLCLAAPSSSPIDSFTPTVGHQLLVNRLEPLSQNTPNNAWIEINPTNCYSPSSSSVTPISQRRFSPFNVTTPNIDCAALHDNDVLVLANPCIQAEPSSCASRTETCGKISFENTDRYFQPKFEQDYRQDQHDGVSEFDLIQCPCSHQGECCEQKRKNIKLSPAPSESLSNVTSTPLCEKSNQPDKCRISNENLNIGNRSITDTMNDNFHNSSYISVPVYTLQTLQFVQNSDASDSLIWKFDGRDKIV